MQHMQQAYVMSPEAAFGADMSQGMQGMAGMAMPIVMGPMGPMMAGPMPPGMMPPGAMAAPQLTQMLVEAARGGRSSNVFFKTRICNKWRAGACPYGDKCTYAHGEHELRYVPPEIVAQLEAQQKMQEAMKLRQGGAGGPAAEMQRGGSGGEDGNGAGHGGQHGAHGAGHQSYYKTRLCIKYMQTGYCHKAGTCTFAHGYEDLRQPGAPLSPGRMQDPMSPGRMAMGGPGMAMMPAGMMMGMPMSPGGMSPGGMSPGSMTAGRGMVGPAGMPAVPMGMPMPMGVMPPGASAGGRYPPGGQGGAQRSPRAGGGREDPAAAARRRAATMCQLTGVGEAGGEDASPRTMQAALGEVRSGAAYRETPYSDEAADYVQPGGAANGPGSS